MLLRSIPNNYIVPWAGGPRPSQPLNTSVYPSQELPPLHSPFRSLLVVVCCCISLSHLAMASQRMTTGDVRRSSAYVGFEVLKLPALDRHAPSRTSTLRLLEVCLAACRLLGPATPSYSHLRSYKPIHRPQPIILPLIASPISFLVATGLNLVVSSGSFRATSV